jgi:uncharacterized RDD family membrane protein YckC
MCTSYIKEIQETFSNKKTEELISIYKRNNRNEWSDEAFTAIENILTERNIKLPEQTIFKPKRSEDDEKNIVSPLKRLANFLIDGFILMLISYAILAVTYKTGLPQIFLPVGYFLYYLILESSSGKTIGKMITNTKVIKTDGSKPEVFDIGLRTLCRMIPLEPLFMKNDNTWLHDRLSGTIVVPGIVEYKTIVCLNCNSELELTQKELMKKEYLCPLCGCKIRGELISKPLVKCKQCKKNVELDSKEFTAKEFTCPICKSLNTKYRVFYS